MAIKNGIVLRICHGHACGKQSGGLERAARAVIEEHRLSEHVVIDEEVCFGRCMIAPNILVERWQDGQRNEQAFMSLMMNIPHNDMRFESCVRVEDLPALIRWHVEEWMKDHAKSKK